MMRSIKLYVLFLLAGLTSCITIKLNDSSIDPNANTVSVAYLPTYATLADPSLSQSLTEALRDIFVNQSRLDLVDAYGDYRFEGEITGYSIAPVAITGDETAAQSRLTVTVRIRFDNMADPEQGQQEHTFSAFADYDRDQDLQSIEQELLEEINAQLVQDIFNKYTSNW